MKNQMKRFAITVFALLYFISTTGIAWTSFYCCGKLKNTYIYHLNNQSKDCKGDKQASGCCDTKAFYAKIKDDHSPVTFKIDLTDAGTVLFTLPFTSLYNNVVESLSTFAHAPPILNEQPVYLALNNFRI